MLKRLLLCAALVFTPAVVEAASTAAPVITGYLTNTLQPNCAQTPCFVPYGPPGGAGSGTIAIPYSYTALAGGQYNQSATSATPLTIPTGAVYARICAITGAFNFVDSTNGTPTTGTAPAVGTPLSAGSCILEQGATVLSAFQLINAVASTGTWTAVYFK